MWYFAWVLGAGFACAFAILNAMWLELQEDGRRARATAVREPTGAVTGSTLARRRLARGGARRERRAACFFRLRSATA